MKIIIIDYLTNSTMQTYYGKGDAECGRFTINDEKQYHSYGSTAAFAGPCSFDEIFHYDNGTNLLFEFLN